MINLNEKLEITTTRHAPQLNDKEYKYYNHDFSAIPRSLETMYRYQYSMDYYSSALHPFNVRCLE